MREDDDGVNDADNIFPNLKDLRSFRKDVYVLYENGYIKRLSRDFPLLELFVFSANITTPWCVFYCRSVLVYVASSEYEGVISVHNTELQMSSQSQ